MTKVSYIIMLLLLSGCFKITKYIPPKVDENSFIRNPEFKPPPSTPNYQLFLIGDTGEPNLEGEDSVFSNFTRHIKTSNTLGVHNMVLLLGDNIYKHGYLTGSREAASLSRKKLEVQVNYLSGIESKSYFIPGNHDYTYKNPIVGRSRVKRQFEKVSEFNENNIFFTPDPNDKKRWVDVIKIRSATDSLGIIVIDTQRFLNYFQSKRKLGNQMIANILYEVHKSPDIKTWLFATHHPLQSVGKHGIATGFKFRQDLKQNKYRMLRKRLNQMVQSLMEEQPNLNIIFASGHDHSLQLFEESNYVQIISGAGSKSTKIFTDTPSETLKFAQANVGYAVLSFYSNQDIWVEFYGAYGARKQNYLLYSQKLF